MVCSWVKKDSSLNKQKLLGQKSRKETTTIHTMKIRVVQIWGFLMTVLGWIFVACTMAMEGWKIASVGGMGGSAVIKVAWHWTSLWRSCFTDSTAVTNCKDFPVLWSVEGMSTYSVFKLYLFSFANQECLYKPLSVLYCHSRLCPNSESPVDVGSFCRHAGVCT